jgi:hypothetical protein
LFRIEITNSLNRLSVLPTMPDATKNGGRINGEKPGPARPRARRL